MKLVEFSKFDDVAHGPLRAYNRAVVFSNLFEDYGKGMAEEYANQFSKEDRLRMAQIIAAVRRFGKKKVQQIVTEGVDFPEYQAELDVEVLPEAIQ